AVISGSAALKFFLPDEKWAASDLDIYVGDHTYEDFVALVTTDVRINFKPYVPAEDENGLHTKSVISYGSGMLAVRRFVTPTGRYVDIVRSSLETPLIPLYYFLSTLLVNYISPTHCGCGYPGLTLYR
ncbi:hypothetical protein C8Q76DRAFT_585544, partial [Earliella scabrosa]